MRTLGTLSPATPPGARLRFAPVSLSFSRTTVARFAANSVYTTDRGGETGRWGFNVEPATCQLVSSRVRRGSTFPLSSRDFAANVRLRYAAPPLWSLLPRPSKDLQINGPVIEPVMARISVTVIRPDLGISKTSFPRPLRLIQPRTTRLFGTPCRPPLSVLGKKTIAERWFPSSCSCFVTSFNLVLTRLPFVYYFFLFINDLNLVCYLMAMRRFRDCSKADIAWRYLALHLW